MSIAADDGGGAGEMNREFRFKDEEMHIEFSSQWFSEKSWLVMQQGWQQMMSDYCMQRNWR